MLDALNQSTQKLHKRLAEKAFYESNPFPTHVFPNSLQLCLDKFISHFRFPVDYLASSMLITAASAIGSSRCLRFLWDEYAILFMLIIGKPGANKSNAIKYALNPIIEKEAKSHKAMLSNLQQMENKQNQEWDRQIDQSLFRMITTDITPEALIGLLSSNPRGTIIWSDEIINHLSQSSKSFRLLLSLFSRIPISHDRKTNRENLRIENPICSAIGTIQTEIALNEFRKDNKFKSGLVERFLIVEVEKEEKNLWEQKLLDPEAVQTWNEIINWLFSLEEYRDDDGNLQPPCIVQYSEEAAEAIMQYRNSESKCAFELDESSQARINAKMDNYLLRLSLVLHYLHCACANEDSNVISLTTAQGSIALTEYFKQKAFAFWEKLGRKSPLDHLTEQKRKIYKTLENTFRTSEAVRAAKRHDMPERSLKYWLKNDTELFKRLGHGVFEKKFKS